MCRIVVNPSDLAETASLLEETAGDYQAVGTHVWGCDCGCMPADVGAVVDAVTAEVRSVLQSIAAELTTQASGLAWRSGVDQNDHATAISAASGPGIDQRSDVEVVTGGGFDPSVFGAPQYTVIGGTGDAFTFDSQPQLSTISSGGFDTSVFGGSPQYTVVGGDESEAFNLGTRPEYTTVMGGAFDGSVFGGDGSASVLNVGDSGVLDILRDPYDVPGVGRIPEWGYGEPIIVSPGGYAPGSMDLGTTLGVIHSWGNVNINAGPSLFPNPNAWNPYVYRPR